MSNQNGKLSVREGNSIALMILSAIAFSGLAPLSVLTVNISETGLLFIASAVAALTHLPFLRWQQLRTQKIRATHIAEAFLGGVILTFAYVVFAYSIRISENAFLPTLIFELYPLGLLIFALVLLAPERFSSAQIFWICASIIGVVSLTFDRHEFDGPIWSQMSEIFKPGFLGAAASVVLFSLGVTLVGRARDRVGASTQSSIFCSFIARIGGVLAMLPFVVAEGPTLFQLDHTTLIYAVAYGIIVIGISNIFFYISTSMATSHVIVTIMYFGPVLSMAWLTLLGYGEFTPFIALGGGLIILSNLMLHLMRDGKPSYTVTVVWMYCVGCIIFFVPAELLSGLGGARNHYFEAISASVLFFALLYGFMIDRFNRRIEKEEDMLVKLLNQPGHDAAQDALVAAKRRLLHMSSSASPATLKQTYQHLVDERVPGFDYDLLDAFVLSRTKGTSLGEIFVLSLTALLAVLSAVLLRPGGFFYDIFGLIVSVSVVFITLTIYDAYRERNLLLRGSFDDHERFSNGPGSHDFILNSNAFDRSGESERFVTIVLLSLLVCVFSGLYFSRDKVSYQKPAVQRGEVIPWSRSLSEICQCQRDQSLYRPSDKLDFSFGSLGNSERPNQTSARNPTVDPKASYVTSAVALSALAPD